MKFRFLPVALLLALSVIILQSCNSDSKGTGELTDSTENTTNEGFETFYQVPSPEDLFVFLRQGNLGYRSDILNPIDRIEKYTDTRSREINFGIYSADLAYAAAYSEFQESFSKISSVRKLSEQIDLAASFDEALQKRIDELFSGKTTNPDSLLAITNSSYYNMVAYLESNNRQRTLALVSAGGWIESLFIVTNLVQKYDAKNATVQQIADQKLSFENLVMYLEQNASDASVKTTLDELNKIKAVYDQLKTVEVPGVNGASDKGKITVGGKTRIEITETQFNELKQKIAEVRNNFTSVTVK